MTRAAVPPLVFGLRLSIMQAAPVGLIAVGGASAIGTVLGLREGLVRCRAAAVIGLIGMALAPVGVRLTGTKTCSAGAVRESAPPRLRIGPHAGRRGPRWPVGAGSAWSS